MGLNPKLWGFLFLLEFDVVTAITRYSCYLCKSSLPLLNHVIFLVLVSWIGVLHSPLMLWGGDGEPYIVIKLWVAWQAWSFQFLCMKSQVTVTFFSKFFNATVSFWDPISRIWEQGTFIQFSSPLSRSFCHLNWTPLFFDLQQCIRDIFGAADKQNTEAYV